VREAQEVAAAVRRHRGPKQRLLPRCSLSLPYVPSVWYRHSGHHLSVDCGAADHPRRAGHRWKFEQIGNAVTTMASLMSGTWVQDRSKAAARSRPTLYACSARRAHAPEADAVSVFHSTNSRQCRAGGGPFRLSNGLTTPVPRSGSRRISALPACAGSPSPSDRNGSSAFPSCRVD
jgi:hypothetical protein